MDLLVKDYLWGVLQHRSGEEQLAAEKIGRSLRFTMKKLVVIASVVSMLLSVGCGAVVRESAESDSDSATAEFSAFDQADA